MPPGAAIATPHPAGLSALEACGFRPKAAVQAAVLAVVAVESKAEFAETALDAVALLQGCLLPHLSFLQRQDIYQLSPSWQTENG